MCVCFLALPNANIAPHSAYFFALHRFLPIPLMTSSLARTWDFGSALPHQDMGRGGVKVFSTRPKINSSFFPSSGIFPLKTTCLQRALRRRRRRPNRLPNSISPPPASDDKPFALFTHSAPHKNGYYNTRSLIAAFFPPRLCSVLSCLDAYSALLAILIGMRYFSTFAALPH